MRVLYDDQGFFEHHGGVSRYFTELMKRLPDDVEYCLPFESTSNVYLQQAPFNLPPHRRSVDDFVARWGGERWRPVLSRIYWRCAEWMPGFRAGECESRRRIVAALKGGDFDVFHMTGPHWVRDDWKIVAGKKPIVVTVHDLVPDIIWGNKRVIACRRRVLDAASHVIAVSESTKKDLIRMYDVSEEKISVIYHGCVRQDAGVGGEPPVKTPYLLYVGKRDGYKNFAWLVRVLAPFLKMHEGMRLFCTGSPFNPEELKMLSRLGIADCVQQGFVPDDQMPSLFANAEAFIYPSLYEGFGMPILDAFTSGCPTLLSNASCFPEIGGDAALYFDPQGDGSDLIGQIESVVNCGSDARDRRRSLVEKAKIRVREFSREACVRKTLAVYRKVA